MCGLAWSQSLPVGDLSHDGPATPEQISLLLPVTGSLPQTATATVRYRLSGSSQWLVGHPLYRIRPSYSTTPAVGSLQDAFAWPIIDLQPGTTYEVEVTVSSSGSQVVKSAQFATRALPPDAGPPNKTISAGASSATIQSVFNSLVPGDVVEFADGTYNIDNIEIDRSGSENSPIYIRGQSRDGVILRDTNGYILRLRNASHLVIENLTLSGAGSDGGVSSGHSGIYGGGNGNGTRRNTIRNLVVTGVDKGIVFYDEISEALVYNNRLIGNNVWNSTFLGSNITWDDDGMNLPGTGNVAFQNSISRFGDSMSYAQHVASDTLTETRGVHYYRNDIRNSGDDLVEVDHAQRNITFYDNRSHNSANCDSLDPLYGGPFLYARNICINPARVNTHKWNDTNTGQFLYNNTFIGTKSAVGYDPDVSGWYQPNVGAQRSYGYQNNIQVYRGDGNLLWLESSGHDPIDWTHNSWYPNRAIQWGGNYSSLSSAQSSLGNTTPIFSGSNRRMANDNITTSNPWTTTIQLGSDSLVEVVNSYSPVLSSGSAPKNSGTVIPNITDGYSGAAPDRGALISGRPQPVWGASGAIPPGSKKPNPPEQLTIE
jgi:hypothetical protein